MQDLSPGWVTDELSPADVHFGYTVGVEKFVDFERSGERHRTIVLWTALETAVRTFLSTDVGYLDGGTEGTMTDTLLVTGRTVTIHSPFTSLVYADVTSRML